MLWEFTHNLILCTFSITLIMAAIVGFTLMMSMIFRAAEKEVHAHILEEAITFISGAVKEAQNDSDTGDC